MTSNIDNQSEQVNSDIQYARQCAHNEYNNAIAFCNLHKIPSDIAINHASASANIIYFRSLVQAHSLHCAKNQINFNNIFDEKTNNIDTNNAKLDDVISNDVITNDVITNDVKTNDIKTNDIIKTNEKIPDVKTDNDGSCDDNQNEWITIPIKRVNTRRIRDEEITWIRKPFPKLIEIFQNIGCIDKVTGKRVNAFNFRKECGKDNVKFEWDIAIGTISLKTNSREKMNKYAQKLRSLIEITKTINI